MAEFKAGTREQVKNGQAQYVAGDIVSKDAINTVGAAATSRPPKVASEKASSFTASRACSAHGLPAAGRPVLNKEKEKETYLHNTS